MRAVGKEAPMGLCLRSAELRGSAPKGSRSPGPLCSARTRGRGCPALGLEPPGAERNRAEQPLPAEQLPQHPGPPLGPPPAFVAGRAAGGQRRGLHGDFGLRPPRAAGGARRQGPLCCAARGSARGRHTKAAAPLRDLRAAGRMQPRGLLLLLALLLLAATSEAAKAKKEKAKKEGSECQDWHWGPCVPNSKDCGLGYREGTCGDESRKLKCKIPCNWKKKFGADCKYKFESWGGCSAQTGVKTRSGVLKKALYNAQCEEVVYVSKPCAAKMKAKAKAKKSKGKD